MGASKRKSESDPGSLQQRLAKRFGIFSSKQRRPKPAKAQSSNKRQKVSSSSSVRASGSCEDPTEQVSVGCAADLDPGDIDEPAEVHLARHRNRHDKCARCRLLASCHAWMFPFGP